MALRTRPRLFFDLETSLGKAYAWKPGYKITLTYDDFFWLPRIICACWKWETRREVHYATWDKGQDDKVILEALLPAMNAAGEIVAHNGNRFDLPWVRTRALYHRLPCPPSFVSLDTLRKARGSFYFPSNRLDALGKYILGEGKKPLGKDAWIRLTELNCQKTLARLVSYCKKDVRLLEQVFTILSPYIKPVSHRGEYLSECPECGSPETIVNLRRKTAAGTPMIQFKCKQCGKHHSVSASRFDRDRAARDQGS